jgi:hypothetical protein
MSTRYLHRRPLPRLGGYGVVVSILGSWGLDSASMSGLVSGSISGLRWFGSVPGSVSDAISGAISGSISVSSCYKYGFTAVDRNGVGPLGSLTIYVSPSTISKLYSLSQYPAWPVFPSLYTKIGELGSRLYIALVLGLFRIFRASVIYRSARSF